MKNYSVSNKPASNTYRKSLITTSSLLNFPASRQGYESGAVESNILESNILESNMALDINLLCLQ